MSKPRKIHYAGAVRTKRLKILPGWAACCSGDRANEIRESGMHTYEPDEVTCAKCISMMKRGGIL